MLFNSPEFAIFLPVVFLIYWFVLDKAGLGLQNFFVLTASYVFYGWWDWRFLFLVAFSSMVDYGVGRGLAASEETGRRRFLLGLSLTTNLGLLFVFKYYGFFATSLQEALQTVDLELDFPTLKVILPVGISFYTFQTLSYTIDIYRRQLEPTSDVVAFFAYVSFFPQLVAGPIERASVLLPQFLKRRTFDPLLATEGCRQILWGLFKKVVVADSCGALADKVFTHYEELSGLILLFGAFMFAMQIYGDFSGYSDVAIGLSRVFGFELRDNFRYPYFARDIAEFWRRWHISLSTWFRDYLYIPLGGSRGGLGLSVRNVFVIFLVSGFWHGANWTFIAWGFLNALYFLPQMLGKTNRRYLNSVSEGRLLPSFNEAAAILSTFFLTCLAWVFFRADSIADAGHYIFRCIDWVGPAQVVTHMNIIGLGKKHLLLVLFNVAVLLGLEWLNRDKKFGLAISSWPRFSRWMSYYLLMFWILKNFGSERPFIYFQF